MNTTLYGFLDVVYWVFGITVVILAAGLFGFKVAGR